MFQNAKSQHYQGLLGKEVVVVVDAPEPNGKDFLLTVTGSFPFASNARQQVCRGILRQWYRIPRNKGLPHQALQLYF